MKKIICILAIISSSVFAEFKLNVYNAVSRAGYTPGLSAVLTGDNIGIELGGNYALGASTENIEYTGYSVNALLTLRFHVAQDQSLVFKGGGSYRKAITTYTQATVEVIDKEILYYNYGLDYIFEVEEIGSIGFSYFADSFGIVYGVKF